MNFHYLGKVGDCDRIRVYATVLSVISVLASGKSRNKVCIEIRFPIQPGKDTETFLLEDVTLKDD